VSQEGIAQTVADLLVTVQQALLDRATKFRDDNTHDVDNYDDFKTAVSTGFARVWWAGDNAEETQVKEETKATIRCFPIDQPGGTGTCFYTGKPADKVAIFGRAY
jgi:prolyl-tRNA synthetase